MGGAAALVCVCACVLVCLRLRTHTLKKGRLRLLATSFLPGVGRSPAGTEQQEDENDENDEVLRPSPPHPLTSEQLQSHNEPGTNERTDSRSTPQPD